MFGDSADYKPILRIGLLLGSKLEQLQQYLPHFIGFVHLRVECGQRVEVLVFLLRLLHGGPLRLIERLL